MLHIKYMYEHIIIEILIILRAGTRCLQTVQSAWVYKVTELSGVQKVIWSEILCVISKSNKRVPQVGFEVTSIPYIKFYYQ